MSVIELGPGFVPLRLTSYKCKTSSILSTLCHLHTQHEALDLQSPTLTLALTPAMFYHNSLL